MEWFFFCDLFVCLGSQCSLYGFEFDYQSFSVFVFFIGFGSGDVFVGIGQILSQFVGVDFGQWNGFFCQDGQVSWCYFGEIVVDEGFFGFIFVYDGDCIGVDYGYEWGVFWQNVEIVFFVWNDNLVDVIGKQVVFWRDEIEMEFVSYFGFFCLREMEIVYVVFVVIFFVFLIVFLIVLIMQNVCFGR